MAELARPATSMASAACWLAGPSRPRARSISATIASAALVQVASPIARSTPSACCADASAAASCPSHSSTAARPSTAIANCCRRPDRAVSWIASCNAPIAASKRAA